VAGADEKVVKVRGQRSRWQRDQMHLDGQLNHRRRSDWNSGEDGRRDLL